MLDDLADFLSLSERLDLATKDLRVSIIQSTLPLATLGLIIPEFGGTDSVKGFLTENNLEPGTYGLVFKSGFLLTSIGSVVLWNPFLKTEPKITLSPSLL